jgi:uncharacterized membrane protein YozB (DUF420 family)
MDAMDGKLAFWAVAFLNLAAVLVLGLRGAWLARQGRIPAHRRTMLSACALVVLFLGAYLAKTHWLGHEDVARWSLAHRWNLRVHETAVAVMLTAGTLALLRGRRLRRTSRFSGEAADPPAPPALLRGHRRAGRVALLAALLGLATASGILVGMIARG